MGLQYIIWRVRPSRNPFRRRVASGRVAARDDQGRGCALTSTVFTVVWKLTRKHLAHSSSPSNAEAGSTSRLARQEVARAPPDAPRHLQEPLTTRAQLSAAGRQVRRRGSLSGLKLN